MGIVSKRAKAEFFTVNVGNIFKLAGALFGMDSSFKSLTTRLLSHYNDNALMRHYLTIMSQKQHWMDWPEMCKMSG